MQFPERISFSSFVKHYLVLMDAHVILLQYQQNGDKTPAFSRKVTLTKVATNSSLSMLWRYKILAQLKFLSNQTCSVRQQIAAFGLQSLYCRVYNLRRQSENCSSLVRNLSLDCWSSVGFRICEILIGRLAVMSCSSS